MQISFPPTQGWTRVRLTGRLRKECGRGESNSSKNAESLVKPVHLLKSFRERENCYALSNKLRHRSQPWALNGVLLIVIILLILID